MRPKAFSAMILRRPRLGERDVTPLVLEPELGEQEASLERVGRGRVVVEDEHGVESTQGRIRSGPYVTRPPVSESTPPGRSPPSRAPATTAGTRTSRPSRPCAPGEQITLEARDGLDCALGPESTVADVLAIDLRLPHPLTGPVYVDGAEPGDVLSVEILELESAPFGSTCIVPGFGFLADVFTEPYLVKWRLADGIARSDELPGIAIPADMFPGVIGIAPSRELMEETRRREDELRARGGAVADDAPEVAIPSACGGRPADDPASGDRRQHGRARPRRRQHRVLPRARARRPVLARRPALSRKATASAAASRSRSPGAVTVRFDVRKGAGWPLRFPAYETPPRPARRCFATTGLSVTPEGRNESLDLGLATRTALLEMIAYLGHERGLTPEQAYVLASVAVDLRLSEIVDVPESARLRSAAARYLRVVTAERANRERVARARRHQEALNWLEYEQEREAMLRKRLEPMLRDAEGWRADEAAIPGMADEDVATLRRIGFIQHAPDRGGARAVREADRGAGSAARGLGAPAAGLRRLRARAREQLVTWRRFRSSPRATSTRCSRRVRRSRRSARAFVEHARGAWQMPSKVYVEAPPDGDFRAMPAAGGGYAVLKWVTSFPGNPARGLPTVSGVVLLSDARTGELLALLDAASVTARTDGGGRRARGRDAGEGRRRHGWGRRLRGERAGGGAHVPCARPGRPRWPTLARTRPWPPPPSWAPAQP